MGKTTIARHAMRLGLARFEAATRAQLAELLEALAREEEKHRGDR